MLTHFSYGEFNMGLEVPTSSPPKSPTATSPNPNIKLNKIERRLNKTFIKSV